MNSIQFKLFNLILFGFNKILVTLTTLIAFLIPLKKMIINNQQLNLNIMQ